MRMTVDLGTVQSVSPQMVAAMTILQCGTQELSAYLEDLSYENPMMDLLEPKEQAEEPLTTPDLEKLRWLQSYDRQNHSYYRDTVRDSVDQYLHIHQNMGLGDFVQEQILTMDVPTNLRQAMEIIAALLDERGLFTGTTAEIASLSGCTEETATEALRLVRTLEPVGVAAESIQQVLLRQLEPMKKPVALRLVQEHFYHLSSWSDQRIARAMGVSQEAVSAAKCLVATLRPYPSNGFASQEDIQYVTPDVSIFFEDGELTAMVEEGYLPMVHINENYFKLLETAQDPEVRAYLSEKLRQLEQLIGNLSHRKSTLLRCGEIIAQQQAAFFQGGTLVALTLRDAAEALGLHESTICRAVKNKYVQCSRGVFPMSYFFSRDAGQNTGICRSGIQAVLSQIIDQEDKRKPLSDEKIVAELAKKRITLSRRAVAKYRMELGIPPASARKHDR